MVLFARAATQEALGKGVAIAVLVVIIASTSRRHFTGMLDQGRFTNTCGARNPNDFGWIFHPLEGDAIDGLVKQAQFCLSANKGQVIIG